MSEIDVVIYRITDADLNNLVAKETGIETAADSDLGFKMYGYKDADGNLRRLLAKDQNARVLYLNVNNAAGNTTVLNLNVPTSKYGKIIGQVNSTDLMAINWGIDENNSAAGDHIHFYNKNASGYLYLGAELTPARLRITGSDVISRVAFGVGTGFTPDQLLHVYGGTGTRAKIETSAGTAHLELKGYGAAYLWLKDLDETDTWRIAADGGVLKIGSDTAGAESITERFSITTAGLLAIGAHTATLAALDVRNASVLQAMFGSVDYPGTIYLIGNTINGDYSSDADDGTVSLNYRGYQNDVTRYRDTVIYDGKQNKIIEVDGSAGQTIFQSTVSAQKLAIVNSAVAFNRNAAVGGNYDSTKQAFQFTHVSSATPADDYLILQAFSNVATLCQPIKFYADGKTEMGVTGGLLTIRKDDAMDAQEQVIYLADVNFDNVETEGIFSTTDAFAAIGPSMAAGTGVDYGGLEISGISNDGSEGVIPGFTIKAYKNPWDAETDGDYSNLLVECSDINTGTGARQAISIGRLMVVRNYDTDAMRLRVDEGDIELQVLGRIVASDQIIGATITSEGGIDAGDDISTTGIVTEAGVFAEIYLAGGSTAQAIPNATFTKMTGFASNGSSSNCTTDVANDKITITTLGYYKVEFNCSILSNTNNVVFRLAAFLNGVEQTNCECERKIQTGSDVGNTGFIGIIDVSTVPWDLDVRVYQASGGEVTLTPSYASLVVNYFGET